MGGFVSAPIIAALTPALGATGAGIAAGGLIGAGAGAGLAALTGGDVGKGALGGALTGGTIGLAPALGISGIGGTALLGAAGGALGAAATGQDLGRGAIGGAISGGLSGAMRTPTGVEAGSTAGAGASAATGGVGAGASGALPADLTSQFTVGGAGQFPSTSVLDGGAFNPYPSVPTAGVDSVAAAAPSAGVDGFSLGGAATQPLSVSPMTAEGLGIGAANIPEGFAAGPAANVTPEFDFTPRGAVGSSLGPQQGQQTTARGGASQFNYNDSTLGQVFDSLGLPQNTVTEALAKNPGALIAGGGLAYNLLGQKTDPNLDIMKRQAEEMNARGRTLSGYLESGTLPPGAQASINQAKEAAKAKIKSDYAARGMSGSSAELQDLNAVDARAQAQGFSMAAQLLDTGVRQTGLSSEIYANLANLNARRRASTGNAIANFAAALGGGGLTAGRG